MIFDKKFVHLFESLYDGVLIADQLGIVQYVNESYLRITHTKKSDIINLPLEKTRPGSKLVDVIKTGESIRHLRRKVDESEYFSNLVPIFEDGEIIGGVSISSEIQDVKELLKQLKKSEKVISQLQSTVNNFHQAQYTFDEIRGSSNTLNKVKQKAKKFSRGESAVLITGESGTGKELFAQSIHNESSRSNGPFIAVNCATLSGELLESELFGYAAGSFTGADKKGKIGLFQAADGGTLFLDEIGELDVRFQAKLLRVLQEKKIRPLGANKEIPIDVRIVSATNRNLLNMVNDGLFREDLYYRISVFELEIPTLRERRDDISELIDYFSFPIIFPSDIKKILECYSWPGNIRELKNTIQFSIELSSDNEITTDDLPKKIYQFAQQQEIVPTRTLYDFVRDKEKEYILSQLAIYGTNVDGKRKVANLLGVSVATLYNKINS